MAAIAVLGKEVMTPRGLLGLGCDTLDASGPDIAAGLNIFLEEPPSPAVPASTPENGTIPKQGDDKSSSPLPLLIHCTQGKDRTGLMVALVLLICKVPLDSIEYDYELTDAKLGQDPDEVLGRLAEIREMGLPDSFGKTFAGFVPGIVAHLDGKHGGLDTYLDGIGFGSEKRTRLRERLLL